MQRTESGPSCRASRRSIAAGAAALLLSTSAWAQSPPATPSQPSIVTRGEAVVRRAPDRVYITASVETRARNPRDAQRQNAEAMTAVQQAIEKAGMKRDAVRTLGYSIHQDVDYVNGRRVPREYLATNAVEVRLDQVDRAGEFLDLAVQAGATSVTGVRFDLQDRSSVEREAVRLAVVDARGKAEAAAAGAGRALGDVLRIEEASARDVPPGPMMALAREAADQTATPVAPGEIEVRAQVTLTVAIR